MTRKTYAERRRIAEEQLRPVLHMPHPERTAGKRILVYDDVFTDGHTLNEVVRALKAEGGAAAVCGVSLCRQGWRGSRSTIDAAL
jgi:predicted amidophosphoribosyltransferase